MKSGYIALVLDEESRSKLLTAYPPRFPDIIAHHITLAFGIPLSQDILDGFISVFGNSIVEVVGCVSGGGVDAAVVRVNGNLYRPDTKVFHITLSIDRSTGVKPVDANKLLVSYPWNMIKNMSITNPLMLSGRIELL
jgi:hypothetical protein